MFLLLIASKSLFFKRWPRYFQVWCQIGRV